MITTLALVVSACGGKDISPPGYEPTTLSTATETVTDTVTAPPAQTTPTHTATETPVSPCQAVVEEWNTLDDSTPVSIGVSEVLDVRTGQHPCFDRIVIETGSLHQVGFQVGYVSQVVREGSGAPVPVSGNATLQVVINTAGFKFSQCSYNYDWPSLRQVACAGYFEGLTKFAVGVSERKPFAVYHMANADKGTMRVVIDIAH
ncbi:MAG: hypothetical protein WAS27_04520 [Candidatus Saccharimonadales bacterium]